MPNSTLTPVFIGLRVGLHTLVIGLTAFAVARAFAVGSPSAGWILGAGLAFIAVYAVGAKRARAAIWIVTLSALWAVLTWLSPEGAYLVSPLFFLYLHLLPDFRGVVAIMVATVFTICALGFHVGFSVGGVVGPLIGAGVALLIGLAYRALTREAAERERLLAELMRTRAQLAETERAQGALAERARLARDIHDTVAQGLSSIQMLLHAAERDAAAPSLEYLQLARETAAESLADTRQIIRELTPARLDDGLAQALNRLGREHDARTTAAILVHADEFEIPMATQIALLRIAQGALANAVRHANASEIGISLTSNTDYVSLQVSDDGRGFDAAQTHEQASSTASFGLRAMRERVAQLGGRLEVETRPGLGTTVTAHLPRVEEPAASAAARQEGL